VLTQLNYGDKKRGAEDAPADVWRVTWHDAKDLLRSAGKSWLSGVVQSGCFFFVAQFLGNRSGGIFQRRKQTCFT